MLIASAKSWSARGASQQPASMGGYLTISHTRLPCPPSGNTLLFWSDLFVIRRWKRWEDSKLGRSERWEGGEMVSWERREGSEVESWERWQGGKFLVLFKGRGRRVSPRFHLFVSDVNQRNEGAVWIHEDFLVWSHGWKDSPYILCKLLKIWWAKVVSGIRNRRLIYGENCMTLQFKTEERN